MFERDGKGVRITPETSKRIGYGQLCRVVFTVFFAVFFHDFDSVGRILVCAHVSEFLILNLFGGHVWK
jgi:hypothetical protein